MKKIGVVTVGRSDYGIYLPLLKRLRDDAGFELLLYVTGMHLSLRHGETVRGIEEDLFPIAARVPTLDGRDDPAAVAQAMARGVAGFAEVFREQKPDLLVVLGDRFEMYAAAVAGVPFGIPLLHLHGGELTEGAMDDRFRHSLTKLSHLHAVSTATYARRVIQLGEEPWRVRVTGALALDGLREAPRWDRAEMERRFGLDLSIPPLLATLHPTTVGGEAAEIHADLLLEALAEIGLPVVFTRSNADMGGEAIDSRIRRFCAGRANARLVENFGPGYFSMLALAAAMVGNSSSGLLEAPSFRLPVVNIGTRQQGRLRAANVIDVSFDRERIVEGVRRAVSQSFRASLSGLENPHGDGHAAERLLGWFHEAHPTDELLLKRFHDL